jgi:hypothetical protein
MGSKALAHKEVHFTLNNFTLYQNVLVPGLAGTAWEPSKLEIFSALPPQNLLSATPSPNSLLTHSSFFRLQWN